MSMIVVMTHSHASAGHVHETHGHKISPKNGQKREEEGKSKTKCRTFIDKITSHFSVFSIMMWCFSLP